MFHKRWPARILAGLGRVAVLSVCGAVPALAAADLPWGLECRDQGGRDICVLAQSLHHADRWLATLRLVPEASGARLQVQLPAGVHLASGLFYSVDRGPEQALEFLRCDLQRCYAYRALDPREFRALRNGRALNLRLRPEAQLPPVLLQASLAGVTALTREALK